MNCLQVAGLSFLCWQEQAVKAELMIGQKGECPPGCHLGALPGTSLQLAVL